MDRGFGSCLDNGFLGNACPQCMALQASLSLVASRSSVESETVRRFTVAADVNPTATVSSLSLAHHVGMICYVHPSRITSEGERAEENMEAIYAGPPSRNGPAIHGRGPTVLCPSLATREDQGGARILCPAWVSQRVCPAIVSRPLEDMRATQEQSHHFPILIEGKHGIRRVAPPGDILLSLPARLQVPVQSCFACNEWAETHFNTLAGSVKCPEWNPGEEYMGIDYNLSFPAFTTKDSARCIHLSLFGMWIRPTASPPLSQGHNAPYPAQIQETALGSAVPPCLGFQNGNRDSDSNRDNRQPDSASITPFR
ncbi:hypothetical protein F5Y17DRAFT_461709 [Xylariaceae sp. FL0594]|nr:hypothetical protein F5Y17DRAFT_461709 [Xylariaceae sp. FL0594]